MERTLHSWYVQCRQSLPNALVVLPTPALQPYPQFALYIPLSPTAFGLHHMNGAFDFNATPLVPPSTKAIQEATKQGTWSPMALRVNMLGQQWSIIDATTFIAPRHVKKELEIRCNFPSRSPITLHFCHQQSH